MGVPKFYRWISERYPCLSSLVKEDQIPDFDNFYLDMNGIIHHCSHPNDSDVNFRITEEEIFKNIFKYIEVLFSFIRPQRVLFLAVDGCAPRAKMNQQRARRFRSAKDAKEQEKLAIQKGKAISSEARFDSNCITPGTDFMERLDQHLQYMIAQKISTDPAWKKVDVYYSSHLVPGEGEHKILDFIRFIRSQKEYDPYTRHCLYGLDADLIMLGLSVHEPFTSLLREEVKFGKSSKSAITKPEKINFHLLHLSVLRDYLGHEFEPIKDKLKFKFDQERIIDDWILMGFLVGNDFIPHLPGLHINKNAFDDIFAAYMQTLPKLDGYINEFGILNLARFQAFLDTLEQLDLERVEDEIEDIGWMESKKTANVVEELEDDLWEDVKDEEYQFTAIPDDPSPDNEYDDAVKQKVVAHKEKYYKEKMRLAVVDEKALSDLACEYVRAIQWNLHYYYHGVPSWEWFYPYNYAPYISDLKNFAKLDRDFELGKPFLPFEQLMAVLPEGSKQHLPLVFHHLFSSASPIYDFYPDDFATDLNGKINEWEAVVLIPFIDEVRLLNAVHPLYAKLGEAEKRRNQIGKGYIFRYSAQPSKVPFPAPSKNLQAINPMHAEIMHYDFTFHTLPRKQIRMGRHPSLQGDLYLKGFPTLGFIEHKAELKVGGVQVFNRRAEGRSLIIHIPCPELDQFEAGIQLLGRTAFVNWPFHTLAFVTRVSNGYQVMKAKYSSVTFGDATPEIVQLPVDDREIERYEKEAKDMSMTYKIRKGIAVEKIDAIVYARICVGKRYNIRKDGSGAYLDPEWSPEEIAFPVPLVSYAPDEYVRSRRIQIEDIFPLRSKVYLLCYQYYGCQGVVISHDRVRGTVEVVFDRPTEPMLHNIQNFEHKIAPQYKVAGLAAKALDLTAPIISRITGTVFARLKPDSKEKVNVGLNLKKTKDNTEVRGYTKRVEMDNKPGEYIWQYSTRVLDLINEYQSRFPELFDYWRQTGCQDPYLVDIYGEEAENRLTEISAFLQTLPTYNQAQQACGSKNLDDKVLNEIAAEVGRARAWVSKTPTKFKIFLKPRLLYKYSEEMDKVLPDPTVTWEVYDRVVSVRGSGGVVPVGLRGTVVGISPGQLASAIHVTVQFDESFPVGDADVAIMEVPGFSLINLSHGYRKGEEAEGQGIPTYQRVQPVRN